MTIADRLEALYRLGGADGANRLGLTRNEEEAHRLVEGWMRDAGFAVTRDSAGNLYGRRLGRAADLPEVWIGSHLDTVPGGGRYDGALGVVAGIEAVTRIEETPQRTITVVAFRDEEGVRFGHGFFGSRAVTGMMDADSMERQDRTGVTVREALTQLGIHFEPDGRWLAAPPAAFLELHIEQGPVLAAANAPVGIVSSIAGVVELEIAFEGEEGHAGTTPMVLRKDAGLTAASFQVAAARCAQAIPDAVATVGWVALKPGAGNVVPRLAQLVVDARAPDSERLEMLETALRDAVAHAAQEHRCSARITRVGRAAPVRADERVVAALDVAAPNAPHLASGAGHDAQLLGGAGIPIGMLFVRSLAGGISHSAREYTAASDIASAVAVLARTLPQLCDWANSESGGAPTSPPNAWPSANNEDGGTRAQGA